MLNGTTMFSIQNITKMVPIVPFNVLFAYAGSGERQRHGSSANQSE
jgi:hypothetical protein